MVRDHIAAILMAILLTACGSGGGDGGSQDGALPAMSGDEMESLSQQPDTTTTPNPNPVTQTQQSTTTSPVTQATTFSPVTQTTTSSPVPSTQTLSPTSYGRWENFNQGYYQVEETTWSESSSDWMVHGTPTGSVDNLPQGSDGVSFEYRGPVWGRIYGGVTDHISGPDADYNDGDRVYGRVWAVYETRDRYVYNDDYLSVFFSDMFKELPGGGIVGTRWMTFKGDVGTDKYADGYDPALDVATFTLQAQQFETTPGRERGEAVGSFYGPNGEALAGTFWYQRGSNRIEGTFGGKR